MGRVGCWAPEMMRTARAPPRAGRAVAAVAVVALAACRPDDAAPDTAVVLIESAPESLDRRMAQSANAQRLTGLVTPGLVTFDEQARAVGDLAAAIERPDALTWSFTLRAGARFSTGEPVTAQDVAATYRSVLDPSVGSPLKSKFEAILSIETPAPDRVVFRLKQPYAPFLAELVIGVLPARQVGAEARREVARRPIGAGPFAVERWDEEEEIVLAANPHYVDGSPAIRRVVVRTVRDETTRVLELVKGRADLAVGSVSPAVLPALLASGRVAILRPGGTGYAYLVFNVRSGPAADARVRRAVDCAIDRDAIVKAKFKGTARPATGMLPRSHWAYADTPLCGHDPARARALLDQAGYPDPDGDGPRPRALRLVYKTSTDRFRKSVALAMAEQLRAVGIDVELRTLEFSTFLKQVQRGAFEMASLKWSAVIEPDLLRWVFGCAQVPGEANSFVGWNRGGFCDPELDRAVEAAARAADDEERRRHYAAALERLARDLPYVPLWHEDNVAVVGRRLSGFVASPHGFFTGLAAARLAGSPRGPNPFGPSGAPAGEAAP